VAAALVLSWHALLLWALLAQHVVQVAVPELVMTWLRLEPPALSNPVEPAAGQRPAAARASPVVPLTPLPADPGTAITLPQLAPAPERGPVNWFAEAADAARRQTDEAARLVDAPSLDSKPKALALPAPAQPDRKGDEVNLGNGEYTLFLNDRVAGTRRCFTIIRAEPPPPGVLRPMAIHCDMIPLPGIGDTIEKRRPDYLSRPLPLPRNDAAPVQTRPGPAMGGTPSP
jgi:hypothetical protein